jgi:hypothetical protein
LTFSVLFVLSLANCLHAASPPAEAVWTLVLQLPAQGGIVVEQARGRLQGTPKAVVARLRRSPADARSVRRLVAGRVSLESRGVREVSLAGRMLVVAVAVPGGRRVRAISTNRMPLSEDPSHLTLVNLQLVAEGELNARAPFAVVDEGGKTAVLFQ